MSELKCKNCGNLYEVYQYRNKISNYCSYECRNASYAIKVDSDRVNKNCIICGAIVRLSKSKSKEFKCCSMDCRKKYTSLYSSKPDIIKICELCKKEFTIPGRLTSRAKYRRFCSKGCRSVYAISKSVKGRTSIEIKMAETLKSIGIEFEEQKAMPKQRCVPDFYLPKYNTFLFTDGTYWHTKPRKQFCDARINKRLEKAGYQVIRIWEHDMKKDMNKVTNLIKARLAIS